MNIKKRLKRKYYNGKNALFLAKNSKEYRKKECPEFVDDYILKLKQNKTYKNRKRGSNCIEI